MMKPLFYLLLGGLLWSCEGNVSGEVAGKYENNSSYNYTKTVNGKVVEQVASNRRDQGGFEGEFNVVIGNGDTLITADEMPELNPKITCQGALNPTEVEQLKTAILRNTLDKNRLLTAKVAINDHCLESAAVRDVLALFTMDKYRLDFAKFAYGHVTDKTNYQTVKQAFSLEQTKEQLDAYINAL